MKLPPEDKLTLLQQALWEHDVRQWHNTDRRDPDCLTGRLRVEAILDSVRSFSQGRRILDIGCAQGTVCLLLAEEGFSCLGVDLQEEFISYAEMKYERGDCTFKCANFQELPLSEKFDVILATELIEHVAHPSELLRIIAQRLNPSGIVILTTPNGQYFRSRLPTYDQIEDHEAQERGQFKPDADGHLFLMTRQEIMREMEMAGLRLLQHRYMFTPPVTGYLKLRRIVHPIPIGLRLLAESLILRIEAVASHLAYGQLVVCEKKL